MTISISDVQALREELATILAERDAAVSIGTQLERQLQEAMLTRERANNLIEELLQRVRDDEWSGRCNVSCHCHPEYKSACPECGELEYSKSTAECNSHLPGCARKALIDEVNAFLSIENKLAKERGEDEWSVP